MKGISSAAGTIGGAYGTTALRISYTPTNDGEKVKNHKWVTDSELSNE